MSKKKDQKSKRKVRKVGNLEIGTLSPEASLYQEGTIIIMRGCKPIENKKESKFLEFLSRAPITFNDEEE